MARGILIRDVMRETARHYGLPVETMFEDTGFGANGRERSWPRQTAMALADRLTLSNLAHMGRMFRRDRKTVYSGIRRAEARCSQDAATKEAMRTITKRLLAGVA